MSQISQAGLIERFQGSAPVNVVGLAESLGLKVYESDSRLPTEASGMILKDLVNGGTEGYSIIVRASEPYVRKRFTLAHEIAHFILHRDKIGASLSDDRLYRSGLTNREEIQANQLAADILMPWALIEKYRQRCIGSVALLASEFKVSEAAMRIRLGLS